MEKETIKVLDKEFELFIPHEEILDSILALSKKMSAELNGKNPLFLGILNGSFMFASDLMKNLNFDCAISFLKMSSYSGTSTSGEVKSLIGLNEDIKGRHVVIIEDIIDTGITLEHIIQALAIKNPSQINICTLLLKPEAYTKSYKIDYCAMEIPNDFIVGYGLDYDGYGRNLKNIYKIKQ